MDYHDYAVYHERSSFQRTFHLDRPPKVSLFCADGVVSLQPRGQRAQVQLPNQLSSFLRLECYHRIQI